MKKLIKQSRNYLAKASVAAGSLALSAKTFALDAATDTAIGDAYTAGETSVGLTTAGLVGLVALIVGVGLVIAMLKKA